MPLYSLASLILLKLILPNPHLPAITNPRGVADILDHFGKIDSHVVAVVPNTTEIEVNASGVNHKRYLMYDLLIGVFGISEQFVGIAANNKFV